MTTFWAAASPMMRRSVLVLPSKSPVAAVQGGIQRLSRASRVGRYEAGPRRDGVVRMSPPGGGGGPAGGGGRSDFHCGGAAVYGAGRNLSNRRNDSSRRAGVAEGRRGGKPGGFCRL